MNTNRWYAEESRYGWSLNESVPWSSDGWLADFGGGDGEANCKQAAHEHNTHAELLAACRKVVAEIHDTNLARLKPILKACSEAIANAEKQP